MIYIIFTFCVNIVYMTELKSYTRFWPNTHRTLIGPVRTTIPFHYRHMVTAADCFNCIGNTVSYDQLLFQNHNIELIKQPQLHSSSNILRSGTDKKHKRLKNTIRPRSLLNIDPYIIFKKQNRSNPVNEVISFFDKMPLRLDLPFLSQPQTGEIPLESKKLLKNVVPRVRPLPILDFWKALDIFERQLYAATFNKMTETASKNRKENGYSFVQSALLLQLLLMAISAHVDEISQNEIEKSLKFKASYAETINIIRHLLSSFPQADNNLKFYWAYRLVLNPGVTLNDEFFPSAEALHLYIDRLNGAETLENIVNILNDMVQKDSGGALHNTFGIDDIEESNAIFLTTLYFRGRWRSAPTVLNGTFPFIDDEESKRSVRCIRINDMMRYADLTEWDAEAIEIFYATEGLSLLIIVPRGRSLRHLSSRVAATSIELISARMQAMRIAATLPLYTLRMTVLIPDKLKTLGMPQLAKVSNSNSTITMSQAVQRIMFWSEAGRNAFKDDGVEWDETPELKLVINRPYIFFVRWRNITLMNGHFVL